MEHCHNVLDPRTLALIASSVKAPVTEILHILLAKEQTVWRGTFVKGQCEASLSIFSSSS
jgi:hypothetical protein